MIQHVLAPPDSPARLAALYRTALLDTPAEEAFDRLTRLAARLLGAPVAFVALMDQDRQFLKSGSGLPEPLASRRSLPLSYAFVQQVVRSRELVVVDDARGDPLTRHNAAVRELNWVAYLGVPLVTRDGHVLGALSAVDTMPRLWSERDADLLRDLAASVATEIELRSAIAAREAGRGDAPERPAEPADPVADPFADAGAGIAVLSIDGRWLRVNRALGELLGTDPDALVGQPMASVTQPEDVAAEQEAMRLLRAGECPSYQIEKRFRHSSGRIVPALVTMSVVRRPGGEPDHLVAVVQEITDGTSAGSGTRGSEVIRDWDLPADLMTWLAGPGMLFGYDAAGLGASAAGWYERLHATDRERVVAGIAAAIARGDRTWTDAYRFRCADGTYAHVRDRAVVTYDESGAPARLVAAMVEISAAVSRGPDAADHLRQMQKMEAVGQLAGGIAHDFNNLLTGILSFCDLILQELRPDDPIRGDVEQIRQAAQRAATLTRQLLAFSRRQVLQPRVLSLNSVIDELDSMLRRVLGASITLETELDPGLWHVFADPGQLEQVVVNLVVNARDAMPAGGRVTIATANVRLDALRGTGTGALNPGDYVVLSVGDSGVGMDQATQARIFEPFFTTKELGRGTGLGLSTVFGIVQQSGGEVTVESAPGQGATFRVYLPRHVGPASAAPRPDRRALPGGSETLLLVEDEAAVRASARRLLERYGYTILEARHGADALRIFEANEARIDLVLTDIVMPEMGGRELVERLRAYRPGLKVLFMSGYTEQAITADGVMPPGTGFLEKPFTIDGLMRRLREVLDGSAAAR
jgi:two-component system cell cycle sensor histidine kinase/response regulator CckA